MVGAFPCGLAPVRNRSLMTCECGMVCVTGTQIHKTGSAENVFLLWLVFPPAPIVMKTTRKYEGYECAGVRDRLPLLLIILFTIQTVDLSAIDVNALDSPSYREIFTPG